MRLWLLLVSLLVLSAAAVPQVEIHDFKLKPKSHHMLFEGAPTYSYGCTWTIQIPAPTQKPSSVDIRELSTYVYKYIAFNLSDITPLAGGFQTPSWSTSFELEGVHLGTVVGGHQGYPFVLQPQEYFWGPTRPKVTDRVRGSLMKAGGWPSPTGVPSWTLRVTAISHFDIWSSGALWFGQSMRQRVKGQIRNTF